MSTNPTKLATCQAEIDAMTQEEARQWLIANDREAADFWSELPAETDFKATVGDNCRDFGFDEPLPTIRRPIRLFDNYEIHGCHTYAYDRR